MRIFRHTIAEYTCIKHCGYHRSVTSASMSPFHWITATTAAIPLWIASLSKPWHFPWYYFFRILAGELLLLYLSGFIASFLLIPFTSAGILLCKKCVAAMSFAGRHFDALGSSKPHWSDFAVSVVFVALNILVWFSIAAGDLG
jgi:hypothetical protein